MFDNQRYLTRGVQAEIPLELQLFMWECIDRMPEECDYFQVFRLENFNGIQRIKHFSEQPTYRMEYLIPTDKPITSKVYIIDSDEYSTMLLASEYYTVSTRVKLLHTTKEQYNEYGLPQEKMRRIYNSA